MSKMVNHVDSIPLNAQNGNHVDVELETMNHIFNLPDTIEKLMFHSHNPRHESKPFSTIPVDILHTPKEYVFYLDVPGLSKSDIQVTIEEENTLVIKSGGKRKRDEEEECKYLRLERRSPLKMLRKFRLPEDADSSAVTAKCENGVLTVVVQKLPPPPKPKTVQIAVS